MAFESLSDKLQNIFKNLRGKGRLTEEDVKAALKEVKIALLEADVNFKVVKDFVKKVNERAVGQDVMNSLTPGQMVIKIVNEELTNLMGSETTELKILPDNQITVIMMMGLQGAGKTTTTAKIAGKLKAKGKRPLLVACDVYRPAAIEQLKINGEKQQVPVFSMGDKQKPLNIAKAAIEHAKKNNNNVVILDTAGRLHVDEDMMNELVEIRDNIELTQTVLVVDAMTGQDAVNVAKETIKRDIPFSLICAGLLLILGILGVGDKSGMMLGHFDGVIFIGAFAGYIFYMIKIALKASKEGKKIEIEGGSDEDIKLISVPLSILFIIGGAAAIAVGGDITVDAASRIASDLGMSQTLIGLTIVSIGTSLPELVTSIVAARKNEVDMALGNAIGSNVFNILMVLGIASAISPISIITENIIDLCVLIVFTICVWIFAGTRKKIGRIEGFSMVALYLIYAVYIIIR